MDKAKYVGLAILELSKLHMYEYYYDKLRTSFRLQNLQLHYIDTDGMILNMKTQNIINDLKKLEVFFDFSNLDQNHELFIDQNKKILVNLKQKHLKVFG